jgi:hypothetical protein
MKFLRFLLPLLLLATQSPAQTIFGGGGGSTAPGGSNTQVQFNDSSAFGGSSGFTFDKTNIAITLGGATVTTSNPLLNTTQTWNAGGVTFTGWKLNVTDTASAAASLLMDLQVGGTSKLRFGKTGTITIQGVTVNDLFTFGGTAAGGIAFASNTLGQHYTLIGDSTASGGPAQLKFGSGATITWQSTTRSDSGTTDLIIQRDAANTLALRNSTTAQTFNVYNTYTDASNNELFTAAWAANVFYLQTTKNGTGTNRALHLLSGSNLTFGTSGTDARWQFDTSGHFLAGTDNTYDIGASGATRPRNIYIAGTQTIGGRITGSNEIEAGAATWLGFVGRSNINSPSNGVIGLYNNAQNDFTRLQFGGTTSSFPALKRSTTVLQARLADDSAFGSIQGKLTTDTAYTAGVTVASGYITLYDSTGTAYKVNACTGC